MLVIIKIYSLPVRSIAVSSSRILCIKFLATKCKWQYLLEGRSRRVLVCLVGTTLSFKIDKQEEPFTLRGKVKVLQR